ncbi:hypothetical protein [Gilvimarinus sp. 1_MG-2023]|uniref:hypothetical protein n=1 Tax=Gilvimarinus sp. 1_MG-2023 TaxID=3062638 RepID=UPI0026E3391C|nr:hypothetical protein [Gilvimarinus sp. 1_MG-2023]MDO6746699.1 hypothetical protein [Gilvimarinus sp. 1_MG-2023]
MNNTIRYFKNIANGKIVLWCYLIWYCVTLYYYFDGSLRIWLNSIGISIIIGIALMLSVSNAQQKDHWQTFRLFMMPFCVSSFSSLIKGQGFMLVVPPNTIEQVTSVGACVVFLTFVFCIKKLSRKGLYQ